MRKVDDSLILGAMTYAEYNQMIERLLKQQKTTGEIQNEEILHYTRMNIVRMERLDKTTRLTEDTQRFLKELKKPMIWLTITEGWCGDAAQIVPVVEKMAALNDQLEHKLVLRDEHPELMDQFLTNGARSIPIIVFLDATTHEVLGSWGPRPFIAQGMVMRGKELLAEIEDDLIRKSEYKKLQTKLQKWYARDKTTSIQEEIVETLSAI